MKILKLLCSWLLLTVILSGCSWSTRGSIDPTCRPQIGMAESKFVECACICPLLSPTCSVRLINSTESAYGTRNIYYCVRSDGHLSASFNNGILEFISKY